MKLTIATLTGEKFDVEVKAEDKVKDIKVSIVDFRSIFNLFSSMEALKRMKIR